jgi:hypothetical protein
MTTKTAKKGAAYQKTNSGYGGRRRQNKLAITAFDDYDLCLEKCRGAWSFFAQDKSASAPITNRTWAKVRL